MNHFLRSGSRLSVFLFLVLYLLHITACKTDALFSCTLPSPIEPTGNITSVAFGSCSSQNKDQPILYAIAAKHPDLFLYLGDNIYGDTENMKELQNKYGLLSCKAEFLHLWQSCRVLATWDDHDYGVNDGGMEYPKKEESKSIFLDFWKEPASSQRRNHSGIYTSCYYGDSAHRVQIILLDCRTFRTPLIENTVGDYIANYDSAATILGAEQWNWLKNELLNPAQIRIIASSTQFARSHDGYEAWDNFPLEQKKMFKTIRNTQANGVVFISGDVHLAELSVRDEPNLYPLYDLTSSGLTQLEGVDIANTNRLGNVVLDYNSGAIEIDWNEPDPIVKFKIYGLNGLELYQREIHLSEIHF